MALARPGFVAVALIAAIGGSVLGAELADLKPKIDALVAPLIESETAAGLAVGVLRGEKTAVFGYGKASRSSDKAPDGQTLFEIGSITKVFTGLALADMVQRKELALDDPVDKHLPEPIKLPARDGRAITLLDLATHTSGLPRLPPNFAAVEAGRPDNPYADYTLEQLHDALPTCPLASTPGAKYAYSNLGMGLLGHVLGRRAGTSYEDLIRQRICRPLAMHDTVIALSPQQRLRLADGHNADGLPAGPWDIPTLAGAGALRSTVNDLLQFASANLALRPSPLAAAIEQSHLPRREIGRPGQHMGLGWHLGPDEGLCWHNGQTGGYHSFLALRKPDKIAVVVLSNTGTGVVDALGHRLLRLLAGQPVEPIQVRMPIRLDPAALDRYTGDYGLTPGSSLSVFRDGDKLLAQVTGQAPLRIFPESETRFFYRRANAQITFVKDDEGRFQKLILHQHGLDIPAWKGGLAGQLSRRAIEALFGRPKPRPKKP